MKALPHGTFSVSIENNMMLAAGRGPFNRELIVDYQQAVNQAVETLSGTQWGAVITLYGESLMTPEAEQQLIEAVKDRMNKGMIATASVFLESESATVQHAQMSKIYKSAEANYGLFTDQQEAELWVLSQLPQTT